MKWVELQAKLGEQGTWAVETLAVSPGVWFYQLAGELAGDGLSLEATAKATKYCGTTP